MKVSGQPTKKIKMKIIKQPAVLKSLVKSKHFPADDDSAAQDWQVAVLRSLAFIGLATV